MQIQPLEMTPVKMSAESHLGETLPKEELKTFGKYLHDAWNTTNHLQNKAGAMRQALAAGKVEDVSEVVVASEKAGIAMQLTVHIRNKAIDAYQEIMRMQV